MGFLMRRVQENGPKEALCRRWEGGQFHQQEVKSESKQEQGKLRKNPACSTEKVNSQVQVQVEQVKQSE